MTDEKAHHLTSEQIHEMLEEIDTLRETMRQYEEALRPVLPLQRLWGLTPLETSTLLVVRKTSPYVCTKERLTLAIYGTFDDAPNLKVWDVRLCKIRRLLKSAGVPFTIATSWGRGWFISSADAAAMDEAMRAEAERHRSNVDGDIERAWRNPDRAAVQEAHGYASL